MPCACGRFAGVVALSLLERSGKVCIEAKACLPVSLRVGGFGVAAGFLRGRTRSARMALQAGTGAGARATTRASGRCARGRAVGVLRRAREGRKPGARQRAKRASSAGETFYTLQAGLWRGECGGNTLHLHSWCTNIDVSHGASIRAATASGSGRMKNLPMKAHERGSGGCVMSRMMQPACTGG
jgi:hypothetical protein